MDEALRSADYDMIYLAGCAVNRIVPELIRIEAMDLESVFDESCSHRLGALTYAALDSAREADADYEQTGVGGQTISVRNQEILQKWKRERDSTIYRSMRFDLELEQVLSFLEESGIWYMPLKGIVIREFYPDPALRRAADDDILYDAEYQKQVHSWFLSRGYYADNYRLGIEDNYIKKPFYNFEMHTSLIKGQFPKGYAYYQNVRERLVRNKDDGSEYHFNDEDFYIYMILHGYCHFRMEGVGIRFLLDIYVYIKEKSTELNWTYIYRELKYLEMSEFEEQVHEIAWKIFNNPQNQCGEVLSDEEQGMLENFLRSGVYGSLDNRINAALKEINLKDETPTGWTKFRYVLRRVFPDKEFMSTYSPACAKHKWLIPAVYVVRFFRACFGHNGKIRSELRIVRKIS